MVAVTAVLPTPALRATPSIVTVATSCSDDVQVTQRVTSLLVPSLKLATALNLVEAPCCRSAAAGVTTTEVADAAVTVNWADPACPSNTATMVEVPGVSPVASPKKIVATDGADDVQ